MLRILIPLVLLGVVVYALLFVVRTTRHETEADEGYAVPDEGVPTGDVKADSVTRARERLRRAEERYAARLRSAEEGLGQARQDVEVLRVGAVVLGRCSVLVSGREHELTERTRFGFTQRGSVTYRVDEEGQTSRIVPDDLRTGSLVVSGTDWQEEVHLMPEEFAEAERFVAAGRAAARTVAAARRERAERVGRAWEELEEARVDRAAVDEARMTLEDLLGSGPWVWDVPEPPEED